MKTILNGILWIAVIALLVLIPATGSKVFNAVSNKLAPKEALPDNLKNAKAFSGAGDEAKQAEVPPAAPASAVTETAQTHYMEGLKLYQAGKKAEAKQEWDEGARLDPANKDIQKALKRLEEAEDDAPAAKK
jgi:predicted Abi (CAAX) family protease